MNPFLKISLVLYWILWMAATAQAQDKTTEFTTKVAELLKDYYNFYPTEKIHLTTDKQYYVAGDKIWLQAFVTYDNPVWTDSLSRVLYVELIDSQKQIVQTVLLYIQTNAAKGFLQLPADLSSDHYHLRAYTSWLRNIGEFAFARVPLVVLQPDAPNLLEDEETRSALQLSFFTEGGQLVKNIPSKIAFSAVDGYGRPSVVKGFIQDVNGTKYGDFQTNEQGLGAFKIMPLSEAALQAIVPMPDGTQKVVELPKVKSEGLVLSATHLGKDSIRLQIQHNLNSLSDGSQNYFIIAQAQGKVYFMGASKLESKKITTFISKRGIPEGILHLLVLSENGKLEAERLVFIDKKNDLKIDIKPSQTNYQPRQLITLEITASDLANNPVEAIVSVNVFDTKQAEERLFDQSIESRLLLCSDLEGCPANPAYFLQANPEAQQSLDNWLITQKFARFRWDDLWASKIEPWQFPLERSLVLVGKAYEKKKLPAKDVLVLAISDETGVASGFSDEQGYFLIDNFNFIGQDTLLLISQREKQKNAFKLEILPPEPPKVNIVPPYLHLPKVLSNNLNNSKIHLNWEKLVALADKDAILLDEVTVKATKIKSQNPTKPPYQVLGPEELKNAAPTFNLLFLLQGRVPGLQIYGDPFQPVILLRGIISFTPSPPLILFDDIIVSADFFVGVSPAQIESIEVIPNTSPKATALYGSLGVGGIISVRTKRGEGLSYVYDPFAEKVTRIPMQGFCENKKIVTPDYSKDPTTQLDVRSTIYWDGNLKTDASGKVTITFYAADLPTNYVIQVDGIAQKGNLLGQKKQSIDIIK